MARSWIHFPVRIANSRKICRVGRGASLLRARDAGGRPEVCSMRRSIERRLETGAMQIVWKGMHPRTSNRRVDGFVGGIMRSVLQLRVPEVAGNVDQRGGVNGKALNSSSPAALRFKDTQIEMSHGAGGKASRRLVEGLFAPLLLDAPTERLTDAAHIEVGGANIAFTTDSFVVHPLQFPGGSIGELAVNGTVNDLAVSGARACTMVVTFI